MNLLGRYLHKHSFFFLILSVFITIPSYTQSKKKELETAEDKEFIERLDSGLFIMEHPWRKEIFNLPVRFAPKIPYKGIEEARFSDGWSDKTSEEFWTYLFGWYIETNAALSKKELENNLQHYFDGLMSLINKDKGEIPIKAATKIQLKEKNDQSMIYRGNVMFYDAFFTKNAMTLNLQVEQEFCQQKNKAMITFRFSPKEFNSPIWLKLNSVTVIENLCNH